MQASLARANRGGYDRGARLEDGCTVHFLFGAFLPHVREKRQHGDRMRRITLLALATAAMLALVGVASADRKPSPKERIQIATVVHLPILCARVRVSTETRKPKWGRVSWREGGSQCDPLASNGVTVVKKANGRWRFVTAGSSFTCSELYAKVPRPVVKDLRIRCS